MERFVPKARRGLLLLMLAVVAAGCGGGGSYSDPTNPNPNPPAPPPSGGTPDVVVTIVGDNGAMSFSPDPVVINAGQKIAWRNGDTLVHTATGEDRSGFDTREIAPGAQSDTLTFVAAGEFAYRCNVHPTMVGTVTVR